MKAFEKLIVNVEKDILTNVLVSPKDNSASKNTQEKYITISNGDGKTWIFPCRNIKVGMNLYQPSSLKGKLLKHFLPYCYFIPAIQKMLKIQSKEYSINKDFLKLICRTFNDKSFQLAVFLGTPCIHQKATIQVFSGSKIKGYCKVSSSEKIQELFAHEESILGVLNSKRIKNIPECLYRGWLNSDKAIQIFIQSTAKTIKSKIKHTLLPCHFSFLRDFSDMTKTRLAYEETEFSAVLQGLKKNCEYLQEDKDFSKSDCSTLVYAVGKVEEHYWEGFDMFTAYHRDFTPWNMLYEKSLSDYAGLFVFDFEYAGLTYPPMLDLFHYHTQTAIYEKRYSANKIFTSYLKLKKSKAFRQYSIQKPNFLYLCYLLDIVAFYLERDKGMYSKEIKQNLKVWLNLIVLLTEDIYS